MLMKDRHQANPIFTCRNQTRIHHFYRVNPTPAHIFFPKIKIKMFEIILYIKKMNPVFLESFVIYDIMVVNCFIEIQMFLKNTINFHDV